jgi:hypothetical protein
MYIASDRKLAYDPRVQRLARALDISRPAALGHLHYLWYWCQTYAAEGNVAPENVSVDELASNALWLGDAKVFIDALIRTGWLERRDDGLWLTEWERIGRKSVKEIARDRRKNVARRDAKQRANETPGVTPG